MKVYPSSKFTRSLKKLPRRVQERAIERDLLFRTDPFNPRLETHKLHGAKKDEWAYSVDRVYRISFIFLGSETVLYTDIGDHSIYTH